MVKKERLVEYLFIGAVIAFIIIAIIMAIKPDLGRPPMPVQILPTG